MCGDDYFTEHKLFYLYLLSVYFSTHVSMTFNKSVFVDELGDSLSPETVGSQSVESGSEPNDFLHDFKACITTVSSYKGFLIRVELA